MTDEPLLRSRDPRPLGEVLGKVLRRMRIADDASAVGLFSGWREIVGTPIADNVTPKRLEKRVLLVEVVDSAWATQMKFLETKLLATLREKGIDDVDSLDIRVRRNR